MNTAGKVVALYLAALAAMLSAFELFGPTVLMVPGLLLRAGRDLKPGMRVASLALWGMVFSAIFHRWSLHYGPWPWVGLILARGLPWMLFPLPHLFICRMKSESSGLRIVSGALGYSLVTLALLLGPTGNDWETPMAALTAQPWCLSTLPWLGLVGGSLLLGLSSCLMIGTEPRQAVAGVATLLVWGCLSWAAFAPSKPAEMPPVSLLQTGWAQDKKWDKASIGEAKVRLFQLTEEAAASGAQLVVWPETAWPNRGMRRRFSDSRAIGKLARRLKIQLLATSIEETDDEHWINSVSQVLPSGKFGQEYQKLRLAPFAEYIPLPESVQESLRAYQPFSYISRFVPGTRQEVMELDELRYSVLICFESQVPWPSATLAEKVDFLVVVTNDAPMVDEAPKEHHFRSAVLRAAQFQKPIFQASNNGVTGIVGCGGEVLMRSAPGFTGAGVFQLP